MSKKRTALLMAAAAFGGMIVGQAIPAKAQLGDILTGGAILVVVDQLSGNIDRVINTVTGNKNDNIRTSTRVVPILSIGRGTYVGAVQVSGPKNKVDQVKAVAQLEHNARIGREVRIRALIPVSARSVTNLQSLSRVKGVGVSALVDLKL